MIRLTVEAARWSRDSTGAWLSLLTAHAERVAATLNPDKTYDVEIKEHREKRSLDANRLYWSVLGQLAAVLGQTNAATHNILLRRYGQLEQYGNKLVYVVLPDTDEAAEKAIESETYHLKPTSQTRRGKDGLTYRTYMLLRGSHDYDKREMSRLIDGLLSECREMGLDVISESERALLEEWREK